MGYDYGFNSIGSQLIDECKKATLDFDMINKLLERIDDINTSGHKNILAEIILHYSDRFVDEHCDYCEENECLDCVYKPKELDGKDLPKIITLFLEAGFDVNSENGLIGGACLLNLSRASYDKYILDAAKLLLKSGADPKFNLGKETLINWMATEESAARCCDNDHDQENLFYTMVEILDAASQGKKYDGINYYKNCIGSTVNAIKVLTIKDNFKQYLDGKTIMASHIVFVCGENNLVLKKGLIYL